MWLIMIENLHNPFIGTGIKPATYDSAGIKNAMAQCLSLGGVVQLEDATYTGIFSDSIDITQYPGVSVVGIKPTFTSTGNVSIATEVYTGGSRLQGFGFYGNNTSLPSPITNFGSNAIQGIELRDFLIQGTTGRALDFGAHNSIGLNLCNIDVMLMDCGSADYAAAFVNFANCDNITITTLNSSNLLSGGGVLFKSDVSSAVFIPGNSSISLMQQSYYRINTGVVFTASAGSLLNSLDVKRLQVNKYGQGSFTQNAVFTSASSSIAVTNCEELPVGMPINFTTTANGVTVNLTYVVLSVSATSGAGNITIAASPDSTAITATGSSTLSLVSSGFPNLSVISESSTSNVQSSAFQKLDLESINAVQLWCSRTKECIFNLAEISSSSDQNIVLRNTSNCTTYTQNAATKLDFDAVSAASHRNHGSYNGAPLQYLGWGVMNGHTVGSRGATVAAGAAAGSGATVSNSGGVYDNYGQITVTPAGTPTAGVVATLTFKIPKENACVILTPANAATNALSGAAKIRAQTTPRGTGFDLYVDTALVAGTTYIVNWQAP
jgi:hypothetical protein